MQLHQLKRTHSNKRKKRVGRGGTRGKTSGRGHKGQKARAGGRPRPESRDIIKRIPKRRGYGKHRGESVHSGRVQAAVVNIAALEKHFSAGEMVSPDTLVEKGLVKKQGKRLPDVKILGQGVLVKSLSFKNVSFSSTARAAIEKAGGTIS